MTANKGSGPPIGKTVYISEVNGAMKVKSNAPVANSYKQQLRLREKNFHRVAAKDSVPNSIFSKRLELSETSRARKLIFGLQVDTDKANSCRYNVTR